MPRVKVKVERGNGGQQVVVIDTAATQGARLGSDLYMPNGQVATAASLAQWIGAIAAAAPAQSGGQSLSTVLTTKGDLATRGAHVQRLPVGTQDQALRVSADGMPEWRSGAALTKTDDTNITLTLGGAPESALLAAASLTLGWTGTLAQTRGGWGADISAAAGYAKFTAGVAAFDSSVPWADVSSTPTTIAGYGITDTYTDSEVDGLISGLSSVYQPLSSVLDAYAGGDTPSAFTLGIVDSTDAAAWRTAIGAGTSSFDGAFSSLSGIPTTLAGYGITDAYTDAEVDGLFSSLISNLAPVAFSNDYADLDNLPSLFDGDWGSLANIPAIVDEFAGLSNASGVLTNDGAGNLSWGSGGGAAAWGSITGTLSDQTDLQSALDGKQTSSSVLTAYAGGDTPSAFTLGIVDSANAAAWRTAIGAGTSSFDGAFSSLSGIPTTLAGYGITDAVNTTGNQSSLAGNKSWSGSHTFSNTLTTFFAGSGQQVDIRMSTSGGSLPGNQGRWLHRVAANTGTYLLATLLDDNSASRSALQITRSGSALTAFTFGNTTDNPSYTFAGSGEITAARMFLGSTAGITVGGVSGQLQMHDTAGTGISVARFSNNATGQYITLGKSRGASVGTFTAVVNGDNLGLINFTGADGTNLNSVAASIRAFASGTVSTGVVSGELRFYTASTAGSLVERLRFDNSGTSSFTGSVFVVGPSATPGLRYTAGAVTVALGYESGSAAYIGPTSAHSLGILAGNSTRMFFSSTGGAIMGSPTGGNQGNNTLNVAGNIYVNGVPVLLSTGTAIRSSVPRRTSGLVDGEATHVTSGFTVNSGDIAQGGTYTIINVSGSSITLTQGTATLYKSSDGTTGNITLTARMGVTIRGEAAGVGYVLGA